MGKSSILYTCIYYPQTVRPSERLWANEDKDIRPAPKKQSAGDKVSKHRRSDKSYKDRNKATDIKHEFIGGYSLELDSHASPQQTTLKEKMESLMLKLHVSKMKLHCLS